MTFHHFEANAKETARERQRITKRLAEIKSEQEAVIAQSTQIRLEGLEFEAKRLRGELMDVEKAESRLLHELKPSNREAELVERITRLTHDEVHRVTESGVRGVATKYIRADAVAVLQQEIAELEATSKALLAPFEGSHATPGDKTRHRVHEIEGEISALRGHEKAAILGQQIFAIRTERSELEAELNTLREERRNRALSV